MLYVLSFRCRINGYNVCGDICGDICLDIFSSSRFDSEDRGGSKSLTTTEGRTRRVRAIVVDKR